MSWFKARSCADFAALIDLLVDDELDPERSGMLRGHMRSCSSCRAQYEATCRLVSGARSLGKDDVEPPASLWSGTVTRLAQCSVVRRRPRWGRVALAGAVLILGAVFVDGLRSPVTEEVSRKDSTGPRQYELLAAAALEVNRAEAEYRTIVEELVHLAQKERVAWRPEVARAFDRRKQVFALTTLRERASAYADPANIATKDALFASYRAEIAFLQDAVVAGKVSE